MIVGGALSLLAQLTQGIIGLALLLVGHQTHLAVTTSALAVSAFAVGMAIGRPIQGRALDAISPRTVLVGCGLAHALAYLLVAVVAHQHWAVVYVLTGFTAGVTLPPIGTQLRVDWPKRDVGGHPTRVFALISTLQQVSVLVAPVLFTAVAAVSSPTTAMLLIAGLAGGCTVLFALTAPRTPNARDAGARVQVRRYLRPLVLTGLIGAATGTVEVTAPALALAAGHPGIAGLLVAAATLGTVLGALLAMSRRGRSIDNRVLLSRAAVLEVIGAAVLLVPTPLAVAGIALFVLGIGFTPAYAATAVLVHLRAGGTAEAFGWQSTALGLGVAGGSAVAGGLVSVAVHLSALPAVVCPAACAVLALVGPRGSVNAADDRPRSGASCPSSAPPHPAAAPRPRR